ncbi:hypothetical protein [Algoriphagus winogradskyi]|jgi:hypothetical protein|nr:hypothetical protein [Algoriphagus winogradskyi]
MYLDGKPSSGKAPVQKVTSNSSLKNFYSASPDMGSRKIVSTRVMELLEKYRTGNFIYLSCAIMKGSEIIDSFWITDVIHFDDQQVDFEKSKFELYESWVEKQVEGRALEFGRKLNTITFQNLEELEKYEKNLSHLSYIITRNLVLKSTCKFHLLFLRSFGIFDFIVSEELKNELQKQILDKGIEFKPLELSDNEWYGPNGIRKLYYK